VSDHSGSLNDIHYYEALQLPACTDCGSRDTAVLEAGDDPRLICIASATKKVKLVRYQPRPWQGRVPRYYCNACESWLWTPVSSPRER
jgi:hypothetical protein